MEPRPGKRVLVVEDNPINREIMLDNLREAGYAAEAVDTGQAAWARLTAAPEAFEAVLLDRMLPDMDGLELLRRAKAKESLKLLPIIMQTAMNASADIAEGLSAGAFYYLTKPFDARTLLAIVAAAIEDRRRYEALRREAREAAHAVHLLRRAEFAFRTPDEARGIAALMANTCPDPSRVVLGLSELMLNAVEHGNLGIGYSEKSALIASGRIEEELERRLALPEYRDRQAYLEVTREPDEVRFRIRDSGQGFDWHAYLELSPERAFDTHGRGIAMSRLISFDRLEFIGPGNEVMAAVRTS